MTSNTNRWRTIDIVIASIIAVAFGVIFWAWNLLWSGHRGARSPSSRRRRRCSTASG